MKDVLTRGTVLNEEVRVFCLRTTELVREASRRHHLSRSAETALGRVLTVGCVMGTMLKTDKEKLELTIDGKGPLGQIVVDGYYGGAVRGFVENGSYDDPDSPIGRLIGTDGSLRVVKDLGLKQPFISTVDLQSGEIGDDFAYYFLISEQTPSAVCVGVGYDEKGKMASAGGLIMQLMPGASEESIRIIEDIIRNIKPVSQLMAEYEDPKELIDALFDDYQELGREEPVFRCECSKGKFARIIRKLPVENLQTMIDEDGGCEVVCKMCGNKYQFSKETLEGYVLAQRAKKMS